MYKESTITELSERGFIYPHPLFHGIARLYPNHRPALSAFSYCVLSIAGVTAFLAAHFTLCGAALAGDKLDRFRRASPPATNSRTSKRGVLVTMVPWERGSTTLKLLLWPL